MPAPPPELARFLDLVNAGAYWASHEALEPAWRRDRSEGLHGLILAASAWVHYERSNSAGVMAQARKGLEALAAVPDDCFGLDIPALRRALHQAISWSAAPREQDLPPLRIGPAG